MVCSTFATQHNSLDFCQNFFKPKRRGLRTSWCERYDYDMTRAIDRFTSPTLACLRFVAQRWLLKPLVWSLVRVDIRGIENIESCPGPFIAVANHSSHLDAPLIIGALPRNRARY